MPHVEYDRIAGLWMLVIALGEQHVDSNRNVTSPEFRGKPAPKFSVLEELRILRLRDFGNPSAQSQRQFEALTDFNSDFLYVAVEVPWLQMKLGSFPVIHGQPDG